jgi:hypothetical protein
VTYSQDALFTNFNPTIHPSRNAAHTRVGEAEPANLWHKRWIHSVLEVGVTSANWLEIIEAGVPVDALC